MTPLDIGRFRRLTFALIALLFAGLAVGSITSANALDSVKTKYKVTVAGKHVNSWQSQIGDYPDPDTPWTIGKGKVTSNFKTDRPWTFAAVKYTDLPSVLDGVPAFQLAVPSGDSLKADNSASAKVTTNYVAGCGGELGECQGDEKEGTESANPSCRRPNSKIPIEFVFDPNGRAKLIEIELGQHQSMSRFCGKDFPGQNSIEHLPRVIYLYSAMSRIKNLKKGGGFTVKDSSERGWIGDNADDQGNRFLKKCPKMGGKGTRRCWKTQLTFKIRRVK